MAFRNINAAENAMFSTRFGLGGPTGPIDKDFDNAKSLTWSDAADTTSLDGMQFDVDGAMLLNQTVFLPARKKIEFAINANATLGTQTFFIADRAMTITNIMEVHSTAGTDTGAVTMQVFKDTGTAAPGGGASVMSNTFNLKGTAETPQQATLLAVTGDRVPNPGIQMAVGDRLSAVFTGTLTALAGVVIEVAAYPGYKEEAAVYAMNANASLATQSFFTANRDLTITGVQMIWSAAGTATGTVTIDVQHDTGTTAPGSGTSVLGAAVSAKTTANTVNNVALSSTASNLLMAAGDRLSVVFTGTLTSLAGVVVVVYFAPIFERHEAVFTMLANGSLATQSFFLSNRDYEVLEVSEVHSTAGTDAGTVTIDVQIDKTTTAPGSGATCLASTFNAKGTANTVQFQAPATNLHSRLLKNGDRLTVKFTGTLTALAGVTVTASLAPR